MAAGGVAMSENAHSEHTLGSQRSPRARSLPIRWPSSTARPVLLLFIVLAGDRSQCAEGLDVFL